MSALLSLRRVFLTTPKHTIINNNNNKFTYIFITRLRFHIKMSSNGSNDAYLNFLNKANKDYSGGGGGIAKASVFTSTNSSQIKTAAGEPPLSIKKVVEQERCYITESDEPFEPVTLPWEGTDFPSAEEFGSLIHTTVSPDQIEILPVEEWDPLNQYTDVRNAVVEASNSTPGEAAGKVKVYRVPGKGCRAYYYIVGLDKSEKRRLVGFRALSIES